MRTRVLLCLVLCGAAGAWAHADEGSEVWMGVFLGSLQEHGQELDVPEGGVVITGLAPDGPAAKAGLEVRDVITAIAGEAVTTHGHVVARLQAFKPGDQVAVNLVRAGQQHTLNVDLGSRPKRPPPPMSNPSPTDHDRRRWVAVLDESSPYVGIFMDTLNSQLAAYFGVARGVLIREVPPGSPADAAGLQAGDVIINWGEEAVASTEDVYRLLGEVSAGDEVALTVSRREKQRQIKVTLGSRKGLEHPNQRLLFPQDPMR